MAHSVVMRRLMVVLWLAVVCAGTGCGKDSDSKGQPRSKTEEKTGANLQATGDAAAVTPDDPSAATAADGGAGKGLAGEDRVDIEVPDVVVE